MNTVPRDVTSEEIHTEVVHAADGQEDMVLVELGAVTETKGTGSGIKPDPGNGLWNL